MIHFWFDEYDESRASHRLRALIPSNELKKQGIDSKIVSNITDLKKDDIVIFSKDSSIESMRIVKNYGCIVGFDICDNYFDDDSRHYINFCKESDFVTVNSDSMKTLVKKLTNKDSFDLVDPCERNIIPPSLKDNKIIKLVWYGGKSSLRFVDWENIISKLDNSTINFHLTICSFKVEKVLRNYKNHKKITLINWSWDVQQQLVEESDIVFIPVTYNENLKSYRKLHTKSHNRLVDGIAQGKWVISSKLPSYLPLKKFCWLDDPIEGIKFYTSNKSVVHNKILEGQDWIKKNASSLVSAEQLKYIYFYFKGNK